MEEPRIGVYICHCGTNIAATVDVKKVTEFAAKLPNVAIARDYTYMCSDPGQDLIKIDIKEIGLDRVVVASCSPRMHEPTFQNACEDAGLNPYCFEMANIRDQCSWVHSDIEKATEKAKDLVASAVSKASLLEPLERRRVVVTPAAMVIGGGVTGIYAALEIADKGFKTYLVEKGPSIGGHMAQLDKTFPTLDCSACILTPKMVDASRHPNIELITYAEVKEVEGYIGNYRVKVRKKPRYVDEEKCTGCGECANACRLKDRFPSEFDVGLGKRSAVYAPFPQAVPLIYTADPEDCLMVKRGKCGRATVESTMEGEEVPPCVEACPANAIDFEQKEEEIEIEVGTIVVATGYDLLDVSKRPEYGYEYDEVITGLEFERLSVASGPTGGKIEINARSRFPEGKSNSPKPNRHFIEPKEVVFISCVGSREKGGCEYCSRVCCMYTAKQAHLVGEKIPDASVKIIYNDMRSYGKGFEEFYERVKDEGAIYIRKKLEDPVEVVRKEEDDRVVVKTISEGREIEIEADLVVLANAIIPRKDTDELAKILKISRSADGYFLEAHPKLRPVDTFTDGIFIAGCCQSPKDIPDSVAQADGAAIKASIPLMKGEVEIDPLIASVNDDICAGCRTCESICPYGALSLNDEKVMTVNDVVCKGCGACGSACPSGAISMIHYKNEQIFVQIEAMA
jgi:heterodisulfide reductase subunit A